MIELPSTDFPSAKVLLNHHQSGAEIVGAVLAGHTKGRVFLRSVADLTVGFIYNNGFCAFSGSVADEKFARLCLNWLVRQSEQDFFILYPGNKSWGQALDIVGGESVNKVGRIAYRFKESLFDGASFQPPLGEEFRLARMDAALMATAADTVYPWARGLWKSEAHFERNGIGFCVLKDDRIASLCYSVFVSGLHHEIDILTVGSLRRSGLARAIAIAYIRECLDQNLEPGWNCFAENLASRKLAECLGFVPIDEFFVYAWQR